MPSSNQVKVMSRQHMDLNITKKCRLLFWVDDYPFIHYFFAYSLTMHLLSRVRLTKLTII